MLRNPYDNITMRLLKKDEKTIREAIDAHFKDIEFNFQFTNKNMQRVLTLRQEDFIDSPRTNLENTCAFLGVNTTSDYLDGCAKIVFKSPNQLQLVIQGAVDRPETAPAQLTEDFESFPDTGSNHHPPPKLWRTSRVSPEVMEISSLWLPKWGC